MYSLSPALLYWPPAPSGVGKRGNAGLPTAKTSTTSLRIANRPPGGEYCVKPVSWIDPRSLMRLAAFPAWVGCKEQQVGDPLDAFAVGLKQHVSVLRDV